MKKLQILFLILIDLLTTHLVTADNETWTTWRETSMITAIAIQDNFIWAGTSCGLLKWDRSNNTQFQCFDANVLTNNEITCLLVDS